MRPVSREDRIRAARVMRCAGHTASALMAACGLDIFDARQICQDIPLGWDRGFFRRPSRRHGEGREMNGEAA